MTLDMTNDSFAEGWFVQALRMAKTDIDYALNSLNTGDPRMARERLQASQRALERTLDDWALAVAEKDRRNRSLLEAAAQRRAAIPKRTTPLPPVFPMERNDPPPMFLQKR